MFIVVAQHFFYCIVLLFNPHMRKQQYIADCRLIQQQHRQPVDAHTKPTVGRHAIPHRAEVILVERRLVVITGAESRGHFEEALFLFARVVQSRGRPRMAMDQESALLSGRPSGPPG